MKGFIPLLLIVLILARQPMVVFSAESGALHGENCRPRIAKRDCDSGSAWCKSESGTCKPEMRGRCGKRRGDWYGASQPVTSAAEAHKLLMSYYSGQGYTVSEIIEKRWGYKSDIVDRDGKVIDHVMIDKRSGRIRSLY